MLLLEKGAIEGVGGRIVEEFEAVEDLNGATLLDPYDATIDPRVERRRNDAVAAVGVVVVGGGVRWRVGWVHLRLDPGVVVRDVYDHQRVQLERQSATR